MTELEHAIKHIKTRADAWAVKEVTEALQSISERLDKALSQEPCRVKNELKVELNELKPCTDAVSREEEIKKLKEQPAKVYIDKTDYQRGYIDGVNQMVKELKVERQKSGKWIEQEGWDGDVYYECSVCGEPFCLIEGTPTDNMYNYCPNCGAKMESEE